MAKAPNTSRVLCFWKGFSGVLRKFRFFLLEQFYFFQSDIVLTPLRHEMTAVYFLYRKNRALFFASGISFVFLLAYLIFYWPKKGYHRGQFHHLMVLLYRFPWAFFPPFSLQFLQPLLLPVRSPVYPLPVFGCQAKSYR